MMQFEGPFLILYQNKNLEAHLLCWRSCPINFMCKFMPQLYVLRLLFVFKAFNAFKNLIE